MQGVEGQWSGEMIIGGYEIPLNPSVLTEFNIFNSIHQNLPSLSATFKDDGAVMIGKLGISDGTDITVRVGDGKNGDSGTMIFKVVGDVQSKAGYSSEIISLNAVLDNIPYMRKIITGSVKGSSGDAISKAASMANLSVDLDSTNDSMVWLPNNKPLAAFVKHVAERGWASDSSCMLTAVTDEAVLRYKDLDSIIRGGASVQYGADGIDVLQYEITSKSHVANNIAGYGSTSVNLQGDGKFKELSKVAMRLLGNNTAAGVAIVESLGSLGGRIETRALDAGNTHEKWAEAQHQNRRIKSNFAFDVNILIDTLTAESKLLNMGDLKIYSKATENILDSVTGSYIVTSKVRTLTNNRYFEKLTLTSQSRGG
jgi:hypothetical protein